MGAMPPDGHGVEEDREDVVQEAIPTGDCRRGAACTGTDHRPAPADVVLTGRPRLRRVLSLHEDCSSSDDEFLALTCGDCGDLFPTRGELLSHRLAAHGDKRPHQCPACTATFQRTASLGLHRRTHTADRPHPCQHCGQRFSRRSHVLAHGRSQHPQQGTSTASTASQGHEQQQHRCTVCKDKVFQSAARLANHLKCHSEERTFACQLCHEKFKNRSNMYRHVKKKHPPETRVEHGK